MAFIQQLLPLLRASPSPRVLTVLSGGIHSPLSPELVSTDPELKSSYSLKHAADAAGYYTNLALERFSADPRNAKIEFVHAAPGAVATNWGSEFPWPLPTLINILKPMLMTKEDAAEYLCKELLRPDTAVTPGLVVQNPKARPSKVTAGHTDEMREKVWRSTVDVWSRGGIRISA